MNLKQVVLSALVIYVLSSTTILVAGLAFGEPSANIDPAQSLLLLNKAAQEGIVEKTNQQVDKVTSKTSTSKSTTSKVTAPTTTTKKVSATPNPSPTPTPTPDPTPTPTPTPPPPAPTCGSGGSCTSAQVATHSSKTNCWVKLGSKAYNVTSYVNQHPGGAGAFDGTTCGKDITAQMQGTASSGSLGGKTKNHPSSAYSTLNSYFVANVSG